MSVKQPVKQPVKVSTGLKDAWGQEIFLGDLVVNIVGGDSWTSKTPDVVTRVGSAENFQRNGSSYSKPFHNVVVTAQYVAFKGQLAYEELLDKYQIQLEAVKKKNPPVLCGVATQAYLMPGESRKFYVLRWEDCDEGKKEIVKIRKDMKCCTYLYFLGLTHPKRQRIPARKYEFSSYAKGVSTKKLIELGQDIGVDFSMWYNREITDPTVISILTEFV